MPKYHEKLLPAAGDKLHSQDNIELVRDLDTNLATAWQVMWRFCLLVNLGAQTQWFIYPEIIHETMTAVIYRLLYMGFTAGSIDETLRLGLLDFSHMSSYSGKTSNYLTIAFLPFAKTVFWASSLWMEFPLR